MKREDVKNKIPGITEEQLNWLMQENGADINREKSAATALTKTTVFIHCSLSVFGLGRVTHRPLRGTVWRHRTSRFRFWRPALFPNELRRHEKSTVHFLHSA